MNDFSIPHRAARPFKRHRQRGFTLTEVLLATAVLALVGMIFSATFPLAGRVEKSARNRTNAIRIARREMEALRQLDYAKLDNTSPYGMYTTQFPIIDSATPVNQACTASTPCTFGAIAVDGVGSAATALPSGQADFWISEAKSATPATDVTGSQEGLRRLTVRVRWTEFGTSRSITLVNLVAYTTKT